MTAPHYLPPTLRNLLLATVLASPSLILPAFILTAPAWAESGTGLRGAYYSNTSLVGAPVFTRTDPAIDFQWNQTSPVAALQVNRFSVRWSGQVEAPATGAYTFSTRSDDGVRLWVDGKLLINHWSDHSAAYDQGVPVTLTAGKRYNIQLDYYEDLGNSVIKLLWRYPNQAEQIVPKARLFPVTIPLQAAPAVASRVWLSDLNWFSATNGWGPPELDRSNGEKGPSDGKTITIGGRRYEHGIGVHAQSELRYALDDRYDVFKAVIGVDDEVGDKGSVVFEVWLDGRRAYKSDVFKGSMPGLAIEVPVENVREMRLVVTNAGDGSNFDHADWADARFEGVETVKYLSDMNWISATNGSGPVERDRANGSSASGDGAKLKLRGITYRKGLGTRAVSEIKYNLDKKYELFSAILGVDDSANGGGTVIFEVWGGGTRLHRSDVLDGKDAVKHLALSVKNLETLTLKVLDAGNGNVGDFADWANANLLPIGSDSDAPPTNGVPAVPTSLSAAPGNAQIQLSWKASSGATGYNLYRGTTANGQAATAIASNISGLVYTNAGLANGTKYFYKLRAVNGAGMSGMSNEASATPTGGGGTLPPQTAPSGLTATPGSGMITLRWNAVTGATGYILMRGTTALNTTTTSLTDTGLTNGTAYSYRVAATNAGGAGPFSSSISATPLGSPAAPASLTATPGTSQISLAWPAVQGATSYRVYRGTASNAQAATAIATNLTSPAYVNTGLTMGTTYFYKVTAFNAGGESPRSPEASAAPISVPVAPTGLTASPGNTQITLSWMPVPSAATYNVYRGTAANAQAATAIATGLTAPAFVDTGLTNGTAYFYKVTGVNTAGQGPRSAESSATPSAPAPGVDPATLSAFRLLRQATWGPKPGDVDRVRQMGRDAFLNQEFAAPVSVYPDTLYTEPVEVTQEHFMRLALTGSDQLRQRVAWALHQIWVVSAVEVNNARAIVPYKRILLNGAFGNYRDLMRDMTLNPAMGRYLNMLNNRSQQVTGALPNENYPRELKQLFTLGTSLLQPNGAPVLDSQGRPTPTYTEDDVKELARIFTGWTFGDGNPATVPTRGASENYTVPMEPVAAYHDTGAKNFLGVDFPAGQTARQDLEQALDVIFNHPNVGPFICRQLILHLVTSNPSPAYIGDIAAVFANNGSGVRGDLAAVVRAILDHPEAGLGTLTAGKLMEPALFVISQARALNASVVDTPFMSTLSEEMGQKVFFPPSVFSYFSPGYRIRATNLVGPEFQILTTVTTLSRTNFAGRLISNGFGADVTIDFTPFTSRAADAAALVDYCSLLLMGGQISSEQRAEIISAVSVTPASNTTERARTALYLILAAAQYQVDR